MSRIPKIYCEHCPTKRAAGGKKRLFRSQVEARENMGLMMKHRAFVRKDDYALAAYVCPHNPGKYHVGHRPSTRELFEKREVSRGAA